MTDFLFATPKTIDGVASIIDLFGVYDMYNDSASGEEANRRAFTADMQALQSDMDVAMKIINF